MSGARADLAMWKHLFDEYNCVSLFADDQWLSSTILNLHTDASATIGYGGLYKTHWFYGQRDKQMH